MASHALDQRLFEQTASLINENNTISESSSNRVDLIDGWLKVIDGSERTQLIEGKLKELRDELKLNQPNPDRVQELLFSLAEYTSQVAQGHGMQEQTVNQLENLAMTLRMLAGLQVIDHK